jgi:hypothetical protein
MVLQRILAAPPPPSAAHRAMCRLCLESGYVVPAVVADHVLPHRGDYTPFRWGEPRSLCKACHDGLDRTNNPRSPVRADGTPSDPKHPWNASS